MSYIPYMIIVIFNGISAFATWLKLRFVWMNNHRLYRRLLEKYLSMPYAYFLNQNSSDLSKNVLTEVNNLTKDYLIPILTIITKSMVVIFILGMLFWVDVIVSIFALEAIAFGGIIIFVLVLHITREDISQVIPLASFFAFAGYRLTTVKSCDVLYMLNKDKIVVSGTYD